MPEPLLTRIAERPSVWMVGDRYTVMLSAEETGGAFALLDFEVSPGCGSPPHTHTREDESFRILEGEVEFHIGAEMIVARPGDVVFGPRGVPHWFHNATGAVARMMCIVTPGGLEGFFLAAGVPATDLSRTPPAPGPEDFARLLRLAPDYGIVIPPPPGAAP